MLRLDVPLVVTHPARSSHANEDRFINNPDVPLFAVLDGEGPRAAGIARDAILTETGDALRGASAESAQLQLARGLSIANSRTFAANREGPWAGGSTCVACTICQSILVVAHVGDSRLYVQRGRTWQRVTTDHTLVEEMRGRISDVQARSLREHHAAVVTRVLGVRETVEVDVSAMPIPPGTAILLCTDGAWRAIDPNGDGSDLPSLTDAQAVADRILRFHARAGARDDATVLIARC